MNTIYPNWIHKHQSGLTINTYPKFTITGREWLKPFIAVSNELLWEQRVDCAHFKHNGRIFKTGRYIYFEMANDFIRDYRIFCELTIPGLIAALAFLLYVIRWFLLKMVCKFAIRKLGVQFHFGVEPSWKSAISTIFQHLKSHAK